MRNKPKVVWIQALTCNGNTQSLLSSNASRFEQFLNQFELVYHPSLTHHTTLNDILQSNASYDFLLIEGALTSNTQFLTLSDHSSTAIVEKLIKRSHYVIAVGSCASYGGVHAKFEHNDNVVGVQSVVGKKVLVNRVIIRLTLRGVLYILSGFYKRFTHSKPKGVLH